MPLKPSNQAQRCTSSCPLPQYTHKLQQKLQSFKVDPKDLDLLSPAARQDLKALQSSGLEKIHYRDFLVQVSEGDIWCPSSMWHPMNGSFWVCCVSLQLSPLLGLPTPCLVKDPQALPQVPAARACVAVRGPEHAALERWCDPHIDGCFACMYLYITCMQYLWKQEES